MGAQAPQGTCVHHSPPQTRLGTATPAAMNLQGHCTAHCFRENIFQAPKTPFHPHWLTPHLGPRHHHHSIFRTLRWLVRSKSRGSPAISSTLGAILPMRSAHNYNQPRELAQTALGEAHSPPQRHTAASCSSPSTSAAILTTLA